MPTIDELAVEVISDDQIVSSTIPVDLSTATPARIMRLVVDPTMAGDVLDKLTVDAYGELIVRRWTQGE